MRRENILPIKGLIYKVLNLINLLFTKGGKDNGT